MILHFHQSPPPGSDRLIPHAGLRLEPPGDEALAQAPAGGLSIEFSLEVSPDLWASLRGEVQALLEELKLTEQIRIQ